MDCYNEQGQNGTSSTATRTQDLNVPSGNHNGETVSPHESRNPVPSTPTPTKRTQRTPSKSTSGKKRKNGTPTNQPSIKKFFLPEYSSADEYDSDDDDKVNELKNSVKHLSIHRLPVKMLREWFESPTLSESELIETIISRVNSKMSTTLNPNPSHSEKRDYYLEITPGMSDRFSSTNTDAFKVVVYSWAAKNEDEILKNYGVFEPNIAHNTIIFYYKENEIFALTTRNAWLAIQCYSCVKFPSQISSRLTTDEGNIYEKVFHIVGNIKTSKSAKINPTNFDRLKTGAVSVIKPLRSNCSLFALEEFQSIKENKGKVNILVGYAYVRIMRRMDPKNLHEILNHFAQICNGSETYTYPGEHKEIDIDDFPYIQPVSTEEAHELEEKVIEIIQEFLSHTRQNLDNFDLFDNSIEDYLMAENFEVCIDNQSVANFPSPPTATQVFTKLREHVPVKGTAEQILRKASMRFTIRGCKPEERKIERLLCGEVVLNGRDYLKVMGKWRFFCEDYYFDLHRRFIAMLSEESVLLNQEMQNRLLPISWTDANATTVGEYVTKYTSNNNHANGMHYFTSNIAEKGDNDVEFDMMGVEKDRNGSIHLFIYYLFDRFDGTLKSASARIEKSVENLLGYDSKPSFSTIENFYSLADPLFLQLFPSFESFHDVLKDGNNVSIVLGAATRYKAPDSTVQQPLSFSGVATQNQTVRHAKTLQREKNLPLEFASESLKAMLTRLQQEDGSFIVRICQEFEVPVTNPIDMDSLTVVLKKKLCDAGYAISKSTDREPSRISGKFLKMRNSPGYGILNNRIDNKKLFDSLLSVFGTGFPGIFHKLECIQIFDYLKNKGYTFHVAELL